MSNILNINGKYYDLGTKNSSFLLTAQELKTLGIKNWYFMLEVKNPHLGVQDIDPWKKDITAEEIGKVILECKMNPWYFFRQVIKIPVRGTGICDPILHRAAASLIWCFDHSIDVMLCQPRQTWKTTWCSMVVAYMFLFEYQNTLIPYLHIGEGRCLENADILRDYIVDGLPSYMNPWSKQKKLPGLKSLKYDEHGTGIAIISTADSESKAKDKLRGYTLFGAFIDEWEYLPYINNIISGGAPAMISAREIAQKRHIRTCIMYSSTPGDLETPTGKAAQRMIDATPKFSEQMYDMTDEELKTMFSGMIQETEDGQQQVTTLYIEYNYHQLRKTESWKNTQYTKAVQANDISEYRRGIILQRYRGSDGSIFRQEDIDYITQHVREPDYEIFLLKKYHLYVYKHEIRYPNLNSDTQYFDTKLPYLVGIDIGAGTGTGDNTTCVVVNPYTLEVVAELASPYLGGGLELMRVIIELAKLMPKCIFCPETNTIGKVLLEMIQETQLEYRFYHDPQLDLTKNVVSRDDTSPSALAQRAKNRSYIGTNVTPKIRNYMMELLKRNVHDYRDLINTKLLVKDITNLTIMRGKIQADTGEHDDVVMAYCHVLYVLNYGYDLTRFGIDKNLCTFESGSDDIIEYEQQQSEETVNNLVPYDHPTIYEEQLLNDLINSPLHQEIRGGIDEYGYSYQQYHGSTRKIQTNETLSASDVAFFQDCNASGFGF